MPEQNMGVVSEAVAVFHDVSELDAAVEELRAAGFANDDISLLASEDAVARKLGHRYERVEELEDDPEPLGVLQVHGDRTLVAVDGGEA